ncbi:MAG: chromosome segregation protein SMC [Methanosarcina sp.]|nr:chromosome segregation protein SMC [Methanosarcina sp.]
MYFKRLDIQGFKSFAEPVSIEFHEGITCIVGPNGSGKSNISDAIRWVLGEQSPKMLRGGKMEEIIFSGTANRKSRGMAEVTLVIDNTSQILPIDYGEVAITRRVYRSGESEYSINKVPCRLRDIRELIMDTGIGVDGYSIIGQGKIADVLSSKPENRREIFEEAAGIVKYRTKKEEAERKLADARGNLDRVNDIISEIESRIDGLREESSKATEYLELRDRYKNIEINIILKNIDSIELKNEYIKDDIIELSNHIERCKEEKEAIEKDVAENCERKEKLENLSNENRIKLLNLVETINSLSSESQLRQEKLSNIVKDKERLTFELKTLIDKREKEEKNAEELKKTKVRILEKLEVAQADLEEKNRKLTVLAAETEDASRTIETNKDIIYRLHSFIAGKDSEIKSLKSLGGTLEKRKEQVRSEKELSDSTDSDLKREHEKVLKEREEIQVVLKQIEKESLQAKEDYSRDLDRQKAFQQQLEELKINLGQISARRKMIDEMENAYEGYNHGVKFVVKSNLNGIHGVVADLIKVPSGYETAIETALGGAVQNIICQDDGDAQRAIALLKENKAGRLTFLPLSSIKSTHFNLDEGLIKSEGFQGFAVDCITFEGKYQKVMDYLLGRVVIVDRLKNAVKLSKLGRGGLRFVTLDGEIINAGGAITGGSYRSNTIGLLERKAEAQKLAESHKGLLKKYQTIVQTLEELNQTLAAHKKTIEALDQKYRNIEMDLHTKEGRLDNLALRLADTENVKVKWERELKNIDQEENSAAIMIGKLEDSVNQAKSQIMEAEILAEKAMENYEVAKGRMVSESEGITQARLLAGAAVGEKNNADQLLSRIENSIRDYQEEEKNKNQALDTIEKENHSLIIGGEGLLDQLTYKEKEKEETESLLEQIQEEKILITNYINEIQQKKDTLEGVLTGYQTDKHELSLKLMKNETQVESYKEKLWDDFEISYLQAIDFRKKEFIMSAFMKESREIKNRIKEMGDINVGSIKEYEKVMERYEFLTAQREDLLSAMDALVQIIEDMDRTIRKSFRESLDQIAVCFGQAFQVLFGGGSAELRLEDESRPLETGIEIVAQPPGKKLQNINLMSGGEKTLTAIALMFAILRTKPTPFCILDEVEAALDDVNIERFARYLRDFREIQFALVTHQKATMEYADVLYGVTMPEHGISKVISLKLGDKFEL